MSIIRQRQSDNHSSSTWRDFNPLTRVVFLQRVMLFVPHSAKRYHELALTTEPFFDTILTPEHGVSLLHRWSAQERQLAVDAQMREQRSHRHDCVPLLALLLLHPYNPPVSIALHRAAQLAVSRGDCPALSIFVRAGVDVNAVRDDRTHHRPLHVAAICGDTELLAALFRAGAEQTARTSRGETAFVLAAERGNLEVLKVLLQTGCCPGANACALSAAARGGHVDCVKTLLAAGFDKDGGRFEACSPALQAASDGHDEVLKLLLDAGCNIELASPCMYRPLHFASEHGHVKCVSRLLRAGADKEAQTERFGETPLLLASQAGQAEVLELLLGADCDFDAVGSSGWRPLLEAAYHGHALCVDLLLRAGAEKTATLPDGRSAVCLAAGQGHAVVLKQLLDAGCVADDRALHAAVSSLNPVISSGTDVTDCVAQLLRAGADKNVVRRNTSAAFCAAEWGRVAVLKLLIDAGCDIEWAASSRRTALHAACQHGHIECVRELLRAGANTSRTTRKGMTPADFDRVSVRSSEREQFLKLLEPAVEV